MSDAAFPSVDHDRNQIVDPSLSLNAVRLCTKIEHLRSELPGIDAAAEEARRRWNRTESVPYMVMLRITTSLDKGRALLRAANIRKHSDSFSEEEMLTLIRKFSDHSPGTLVCRAGRNGEEIFVVHERKS